MGFSLPFINRSNKAVWRELREVEWLLHAMKTDWFWGFKRGYCGGLEQVQLYVLKWAPKAIRISFFKPKMAATMQNQCPYIIYRWQLGFLS